LVVLKNFISPRSFKLTLKQPVIKIAFLTVEDTKTDPPAKSSREIL